MNESRTGVSINAEQGHTGVWQRCRIDLGRDARWAGVDAKVSSAARRIQELRQIDGIREGRIANLRRVVRTVESIQQPVATANDHGVRFIDGPGKTESRT